MSNGTTTPELSLAKQEVDITDNAELDKLRHAVSFEKRRRNMYLRGGAIAGLALGLWQTIKLILMGGGPATPFLGAIAGASAVGIGFLVTKVIDGIRGTKQEDEARFRTTEKNLVRRRMG